METGHEMPHSAHNNAEKGGHDATTGQGSAADRRGGGGIADVSNEMGAFMVVRAESHEAAARLFEKQPQSTIFPGESADVMSVLPIPGA
jgi:hypothetical protein